jgi:hypothetical protein
MTYKFPGAKIAPYPIGAQRFDPDRHLRTDSLQCTDSPYLGFSYWLRSRNAGSLVPIWESDPLGEALTYTYSDAGILQIALGSGAVDGNFSVNSDEPLSQNVWHHILGAFKVDVEPMIAVIYVDGERAAFTVEYECDLITAAPINGLPFHIGGNDTHPPDMDLADFWMTFDQNLLVDDDIPEATRRKFTDADGWPVYLGENGELPTGTPPTLFFHREAGSTSTPGFNENRGTGGPMGATSAWPLLALSSPTDPAAPFENPMYAPKDLIIGGPNGAPLRLAGPSSVGTFTLKCVNGVFTWVADT